MARLQALAPNNPTSQQTRQLCQMLLRYCRHLQAALKPGGQAQEGSPEPRLGVGTAALLLVGQPALLMLL